MAKERETDLHIIEGGGEGGLEPWEMERVEQARVAGEAFADEVETEWAKLQSEQTPEATRRSIPSPDSMEYLDYMGAE